MACSIGTHFAHRLTSSTRLLDSPAVSTLLVPRCRRCTFFPQNRLKTQLVRSMATSASKQEGQPDAVVQADKKESPAPMTRTSRRLDFPLSIFDSWDPFSPTRTLRQMIDTVERLFDTSVLAPSSAITDVNRGFRTPWDVTEDESAFYLRVDLPGFDKEDVKVSVEEGVLVIKGERNAEEKDEKWASRSYGRYNTRISLPDNSQMEQIKAELKNGVLSVTVPKAKREEKKHVIDVHVE